MNLKAYDCWASHPQTTSQCYITHICPWFCTTPEDHAAKVPVWCRSSAAITKPKLCSRASRYVLVGDKVCVSAVMIQGGLGLWFFFSFLSANKSTQRDTSSLAGSRAVTPLASGLLFWSSRDGSELCLQLCHSVLFSTLELHQAFRR